MKKSSFIPLTLVMIMAFSVLFLAACKPQNLPDDGEITVDTTADTTCDTAAFESTAEDTTSAVTKLTLGAKYNAICAYDEQGEEISLQVLYGSSFLQYGGYIAFNSDGTFSYSMGVSAKGPSTGTYEFVSDEEIRLLFDSDKEAVVTVIETFEENIIQIKLPENDYYLIFNVSESE